MSAVPAGEESREGEESAVAGLVAGRRDASSPLLGVRLTAPKLNPGYMVSTKRTADMGSAASTAGSSTSTEAVFAVAVEALGSEPVESMGVLGSEATRLGVSAVTAAVVLAVLGVSAESRFGTGWA